MSAVDYSKENALGGRSRHFGRPGKMRRKPCSYLVTQLGGDGMRSPWWDGDYLSRC